MNNGAFGLMNERTRQEIHQIANEEGIAFRLSPSYPHITFRAGGERRASIVEWIRMTAAELSRVKAPPRPKPRLVPKSEQQFVYFIESSVGPIKIGTSNDVQDRLAALRTASPVPLTLLHAFPVWDRIVERHVHRLHAAHRLHGEWFAPSLLRHIALLKWRAEHRETTP